MIDNDTIFDALADGERRHLLVGLYERGRGRVPRLSEQARELVGANDALHRECLSGDVVLDGVDEDALRTHCIHLPQLVENGFVEWDRDANVVTRGPQFDELEPVLELLVDHREDPAAPEAAVALRH